MRGYITLENETLVAQLNAERKEFGEVYGYAPDEGAGDFAKVSHGGIIGDTRAALTPFMAHKEFGDTYKWMLYGDDDTIFYMDNIKTIVEHLDPDLPIVITDDVWGSFKPREMGRYFLFNPRCLPCHTAVDAAPSDGSPARPLPPLEHLMKKYTEVVHAYSNDEVKLIYDKIQEAAVQKAGGANVSVFGVRYAPRPACPFCTVDAACMNHFTPHGLTEGWGVSHRCTPYSGHGGGGFVMSVGLLRRLSVETMKKCYIDITRSTGSDALLTHCLWQQGYAFTDPGYSIFNDYDRTRVVFAPMFEGFCLRDPVSILVQKRYDHLCLWMIEHAASRHFGGRRHLNPASGMPYVWAMVHSRIAAQRVTRMFRRRLGSWREHVAEAGAAALPQRLYAKKASGTFTP